MELFSRRLGDGEQIRFVHYVDEVSCVIIPTMQAAANLILAAIEREGAFGEENAELANMLIMNSIGLLGKINDEFLQATSDPATIGLIGWVKDDILPRFEAVDGFVSGLDESADTFLSASDEGRKYILRGWKVAARMITEIVDLFEKNHKDHILGEKAA